MPEFVVPDGWERYHRQIKSNIDALIQNKVLQGISPSNLMSWYHNFESSEEKYLAAHLLDSMIFRSEEMMRATCRHVVSKTLIQATTDLGLGFASIKAFDKFLKQPKAIELLFTTVTTDVPGKSGEALLRLFALENGLNKNLKTYAEEKDFSGRGVKALIILDDMVGTGNQFKTFYEDKNLAELSEKHAFAVIYIPFMAHVFGINYIKEHCPNVLVKPIELLDEQHDFFRELPKAPGSGIWARDKVNAVDDVKIFYKQLLKDKKISTQTPFGYGDLGLTVYTYLSSPNNSLHVFYTNKNEQWTPLFQR